MHSFGEARSALAQESHSSNAKSKNHHHSRNTLQPIIFVYLKSRARKLKLNQIHNGEMDIDQIFKNNQNWVQEKLNVNANYFDDLSKGQNPEILYIGCSDSSSERLTLLSGGF
jgi:hypothetical protein